MRGKAYLLIFALCAAASAGCDFTLLAPAPAFTPTATPTDTPLPTVTPSPTDTPYPTRTASPTPIPGIEEPVQVGEATLRITKALRRDVYRCGDTSVAVEDPESKEFLVIIWNVVKGPQLAAAEVEEWLRDNDIDGIRLEFRNGAGQTWREHIGYRCPIRNRNTYVITEIHTAFLVDRDAERFILILPEGGEIPLESLLPS
ncbi:MAG: hypothetical protein JW929_08955 [Anaerolineales bacterium]|nr:hypothetical protein [Anaerolineales bacterium]